MANPLLRPEAFSPASPALDQRDTLVRTVLRKAPRRREPRPSRAQNDPVGADVAFERRPWRARRQHAAPAVGVVVARQDSDGRGRGHAASPRRSRGRRLVFRRPWSKLCP